MEIYQLRTFLAVARLGHVTRAAEQLHLTQPAVSKQIKALEEALGVKLFDRTPAGMALTRTGTALVERAQATLDAALDMAHSAAALRTELAGVVRLGTIIDPEFIRLGEFLGTVLRFHPLVDFKLLHGISGGVLEQIEAGWLDAGFYLGRLRSPQVRGVELKLLTYVVGAPADWRSRWQVSAAEAAADTPWDLLARLPWIGTPPASSQNRLVREMFEAVGREFRTTVEADQEASMIDLVRRGVGLCMMRDDLAQAAVTRGEIAIWPQVAQPCPLSFIYPASAADSPLLQALVGIQTELWRGA
jgi:DNA-binding transcriptional LysR family regulator